MSVVALLVIFATIVVLLTKYWFTYNEFKFQSPIVLRTPMWIETKAPKELVNANTKLDELEKKIKTMEASKAAQPADAPVINKLVNSDL